MQDGVKVLVIDDEPDSIKLVGLVLHRHRGDEVVGADGGLAGIAKAQEVMPELIVLDLMMPVLDGYQVYSRLRSLPGLESTPILFVGAREPELVYPPAQSLGAMGYLYEPYGPQQLLAARDAALSGNLYYPPPEHPAQRDCSLGSVALLIAAIALDALLVFIIRTILAP